MTEIKNPYFEKHIHEGNILEIEYTVADLNMYNILPIDNAVRFEIKHLSKIIDKKIILVLNLKNVIEIDSSVIGATIQAWSELKKCNGENTKIYCINITEEIKKTYKLVKLDWNILLLNFDSIEDIIYIEKFKEEIKNEL